MKTGLLINKDDIENDFGWKEGLVLIENGYDHLIIETTPLTYKKARKLMDDLVLYDIKFYIEFPLLWKYSLYDYSTINEFIETYPIDKVFLRIFEGTIFNYQEAAKHVCDNIKGVDIYLYGAVLDPDIIHTNIFKLHKELVDLNVRFVGYSPIVFMSDVKIKQEWIPAIFVKNEDQNSFDVVIKKLSRSYNEVFLFPYDNVIDMVIPKVKDETKFAEFKMVCVIKTHSRVKPNISALVIKKIDPGDVYDILEKIEVNQYETFGRIGQSEWVYLRKQGKNYFDPI